MASGIELIYDAAVADERLKDGTKYERLTAIVFKILQENAYITHDVRLHGDGKDTKHQIDVTIASDPAQQAQRILVECKDYTPGAKVGISEIRDFKGALLQLKPDRGIFVATTEYTRSARSYAREENITLVELRQFTDGYQEKGSGAVPLTIHAYALGRSRTIDFKESGRQVDAPPGLPDSLGNTPADSTPYYDQNGIAQGMLSELLADWLLEDAPRRAPTDGRQQHSGSHVLPQPIWLALNGTLAEFASFDWTAPVLHGTTQVKVDVGNQIADLILRIVQLPQDVHLSDALSINPLKAQERIIFRDQIIRWTVDDHVIKPRTLASRYEKPRRASQSGSVICSQALRKEPPICVICEGSTLSAQCRRERTL